MTGMETVRQFFLKILNNTAKKRLTMFAEDRAGDSSV